MLKALVLKELRETAWIALVGLVAHLAFVANLRRLRRFAVLAGAGIVEEIPFLDSSFMSPSSASSPSRLPWPWGCGRRPWNRAAAPGCFCCTARRACGRCSPPSWPSAAGLYLICGLVAILSYAAWAAMPGNHASPFLWWMTADAWEALGRDYHRLLRRPFWRAFGRRVGSARGYCPWRPAGPLAIAAGFRLAILVGCWAMAVFLLVAACLVGLIDFTARTRDFS